MRSDLFLDGYLPIGSGASRDAICSTKFTMLRRSFGSVIRVNALVSARPSDVARKSEK